MLSNWIMAIRTGNIEKGARLDLVSKWLIITRALIFSITLLSALIGGLLSALDGYFNWGYLLLAALGLTLAHAANNMVNDYFDYTSGVDTADYPRAKYSPHPILSGMVTESKLIFAIFCCLFLDFLIAVYLTWARGWIIMALAVVGLGTSVFYVAPPLRLKKNGLGELAIFLIWGPLMVGGTYFAVSGVLSWKPFLASIPYGLAVTAVLMGKHLDKAEKDREKKVRTLPVLLGDQGARLVTQVMVISFYLTIVFLVAVKVLPVLSLIALLTLPRGIRFVSVLSGTIPLTPIAAFKIAEDVIPRDLKEKFNPEDPAQEFPLWPLWYVIWAVWWTRVAGAYFLVGLLAQLALKKFL
jgi:1,4-dihydroxy-2-naphthoate octaprenyltransferase